MMNKTRFISQCFCLSQELIEKLDNLSRLYKMPKSHLVDFIIRREYELGINRAGIKKFRYPIKAKKQADKKQADKKQADKKSKR